jgi:hypothetical protein
MSWPAHSPTFNLRRVLTTDDTSPLRTEQRVPCQHPAQRAHATRSIASRVRSGRQHHTDDQHPGAHRAISCRVSVDVHLQLQLALRRAVHTQTR